MAKGNLKVEYRMSRRVSSLALPIILGRHIIRQKFVGLAHRISRRGSFLFTLMAVICQSDTLHPNPKPQMDVGGASRPYIFYAKKHQEEEEE